MRFSRPKTVIVLFGFFVGLAIIDGALRSGLILALRTTCNEGVALGILLPAELLWSGSSLFLGIALWQACTRQKSFERLAWSVILLGGLTNAIDRLRHGCVTDYLHLPFFPSFNLADMMLFLGIVFLVATVPTLFSSKNPYVR